MAIRNTWGEDSHIVTWCKSLYMGSSGEQSNSVQYHRPRVLRLRNVLTRIFFVPHLLPLMRGADSSEIRQRYAELTCMLRCMSLESIDSCRLISALAYKMSLHKGHSLDFPITVRVIVFQYSFGEIQTNNPRRVVYAMQLILHSIVCPQSTI